MNHQDSCGCRRQSYANTADTGIGRQANCTSMSILNPQAQHNHQAILGQQGAQAVARPMCPA